MQQLLFKEKKDNEQATIITLSNQKTPRLIKLYSRYKEIGFNDFNLVDMAELSQKQWKNRDFVIPKGYRIDWKYIFIPKTMRSKLFH